MWNSPTMTTWLSLFIKSVPLVLVIPMMLKNLDAGTVNVWTQFMAIIVIQNMVDIGFGSTFVRGFAYAEKGIGNFTDNSKKNNWDTSHLSKNEIINSLFGTMNWVYKGLFIIQILLASIGGTYLLIKPISLALNQTECWYSWIYILLTSGFAIFARKNINILLGFNYVALQKRVDAIINFIFLFTAISVFYLTNSLLYFILISQTYHVIIYFALRNLVHQKIKGLNTNAKFSKSVFLQIWPSAWKSFLGVLFSSGLTRFTSLIYAQNATAINSAVYSLYLQIVSGISSFSQAPFYSKIPLLSSLRANNELPELYEKAKTYMLRVYVVFVAGVLLFDVVGIPIFNLFGKEIHLESPHLFYLLVFAFIFERYGAMHIQLVSTSNKIIWHIANGLNGLFIILFIIIFKNTLDVLVFPLALLLGNLCIYVPVTLSYSYKMNKKNFFKREAKSFLPPLFFLMLVVVIKLSM